MIRGYMRKLSKIEVRDYARTLVPILESSELDGTRSMRIADTIISYAFKGLKPWYRRGSALQGFPASPNFNPMRVIEGYLIFPIPGLNPVVIQSNILGNAYLFIDIIGAGGGGGGGASGTVTPSAGSGQGGGGGGDGGRLIVMTQGPIPPGSQFVTAFGGPGGAAVPGPSTGCVNGQNDPGPSGDTQVILTNGTLSITTPGGSPPSMPTPLTGQCSGGLGGKGGSAVFTYLNNTSIFSTIQLLPRITANANAASILNAGYGGQGVGSEQFDPSNSTPIFISNPLGTTISGGISGSSNTSSSNGGNGASATVNVPSTAIPLRGSGGGGGGGANSGPGPAGSGGKGGPGGPGPIIILVIE